MSVVEVQEDDSTTPKPDLHAAQSDQTSGRKCESSRIFNFRNKKGEERTQKQTVPFESVHIGEQNSQDHATSYSKIFLFRSKFSNYLFSFYNSRSKKISIKHVH
jgi:hypothetical protein